MKTKKDKQLIIQDLIEKFNSAKGYVIIDLFKLKTPIQKKIRDILKNQGGIFQVVKKTLIYKANSNFPLKEEDLKTQIALIWEFDDDLNSLRSLKNLENFNLEPYVISGYFNQRLFSKQEVISLINIPDKTSLLANLNKTLLTQIYYACYVLKFPLTKLLFILSEIKDKK